MILGFNIIPVADWPQIQNGWKTVRYDVHPVIKWLAKYLPIKPYIEVDRPNMVDQDPVMVDLGGVTTLLRTGKSLYCSYAQYEQIKKGIPCTPTTRWPRYARL